MMTVQLLKSIGVKFHLDMSHECINGQKATHADDCPGL